MHINPSPLTTTTHIKKVLANILITLQNCADTIAYINSSIQLNHTFATLLFHLSPKILVKNALTPSLITFNLLTHTFPHIHPSPPEKLRILANLHIPTHNCAHIHQLCAFPVVANQYFKYHTTPSQVELNVAMGKSIIELQRLHRIEVVYNESAKEKEKRSLASERHRNNGNMGVRDY